MHIAIAVGTLMLGGWVLNAPADVDESEETVVVGENRGSETVPPPQLRRPEATLDRGQGADRGQPRGGRTTRGGATVNNNQNQQIRTPQQGTMMPDSPTEGMMPGGEAMMGQPSAPTQSFSGQGSMPTTGPRQPTAPTDRRSHGSGAAAASQSGYRPMSRSSGTTAGGMQSGSATLVPPNTATQQQAPKAFSGYRTPSGVSPYMNLFRRDTGGADNYTTLVRPELEQRYLNQRMGNDIRGLEQNTRMQGMSLQQMQMNQQNRTLQGVATPQYYMNYGGYYNSPNSGQ